MLCRFQHHTSKNSKKCDSPLSWPRDLGQFSSMHCLESFANYLGDAPLIDSVLFSHRVLFSQLFLLSFLCISNQIVLVILSTLILPYLIQIINLNKPVLTRIENSNSCQTFFALTKTFISWQQTHCAVQLEPELWILFSVCLFSRCDNQLEFAPDPDTGT